MPTSNTSTITKLGAITFDDLLREQEIFSSAKPRFDLRDVRFISPSGLVQLAAACYALNHNGHTPVITLSNFSDVPSYLLRSNFVNVVRPVASFNPPFREEFLDAFVHRHGASPLLIEVTKLDSGSDLPSLLDRIVRVLREELHYANEDAYDVAIAVSEVGQNTFEHNEGDDTYGFLAMQVYGQGSRTFLEIGMADTGGGLAETLRRNPQYAHLQTDLEAVQHATQLLVSRHEDPTHGTGLYHLMGTAYKHSGSVQIRSGSGKVRFRMDRKQGWGFTVPHMPGVQIELSLPAKALSP